MVAQGRRLRCATRAALRHSACCRSGGGAVALARQCRGRLAEILLLDQIPRNIFRDTPRAFACDGMALALAQEAVRAGADAALPARERAFLYLPYMHSESAAVHVEALRLYAAPGLEFNLDFERRHAAIIQRFGRYPHRNAILGRPSTPEELAFLGEPGSSF